MLPMLKDVAQAVASGTIKLYEIEKKVYAPVVTGLELRTTWTQAAGTLARAHTGMTKG